MWLDASDPELERNPAAILSSDFELIIPVIGVLPGCNIEIEMRANFGLEPFAFARPPSFVQLRSDECLCTAAFVNCMTHLGTYCLLSARVVTWLHMSTYLQVLEPAVLRTTMG